MRLSGRSIRSQVASTAAIGRLFDTTITHVRAPGSVPDPAPCGTPCGGPEVTSRRDLVLVPSGFGRRPPYGTVGTFCAQKRAEEGHRLCRRAVRGSTPDPTIADKGQQVAEVASGGRADEGPPNAGTKHPGRR